MNAARPLFNYSIHEFYSLAPEPKFRGFYVYRFRLSMVRIAACAILPCRLGLIFLPSGVPLPFR